MRRLMLLSDDERWTIYQGLQLHIEDLRSPKGGVTEEYDPKYDVWRRAISENEKDALKILRKMEV